MLIDSAFFNDLMGYYIPNFNKWYLLAVNDIKYLFPCYTEDLEVEQLEILKQAIAFQMDHRFINNDAINGVGNFSVGKFSVNRNQGTKITRFNRDVFDMLRPIFNCSLWVNVGDCSC